MKYDVIIVGAGPAGMFCAYELIENNPELKIAILEKGKFAENRICPMNKLKTECKNCNPCGILSGYGGAGTFSDGKLNFIPKLGKSDLFKYMGEQEAYDLIDDTEKIFNKFNMDAEVFPSNMDEAKEIQKEVAKLGQRLLLIKQKHLGSDHLPKYIEDFSKYLKQKGVEIFENTDVTDIESIKKDLHKTTYKKGKEQITLESKKVVVAPGLPPKALQSLMQLVLLWPAHSKGLLALQAPRFPLPSLPSVADFCIPERSLLFAQDLQSSSGLAKPLMLSGG